MKKGEKKQSVIASAMAMAAGTFSSRVLGLLRDVVLAASFSRTVTDAFIVAFRLPNMFRRLLGEGSLSVSFIPVYIEQLALQPGESEEQAKARAKELSSAIYTLLLSVSVALTALGIIFMEPLLGFLVSGKGYMEVAGKFENTLLLARIMFLYLFLVTSYAFYMAVMNAHKSFFLPAIGPTCFNFCLIVAALLPQSLTSFPGQFLAWGVITGGVVQVLVVLVPLWKKQLLPKLRFKKLPKKANTVLVNMVPGILGFGILQIMGLINIKFASRLSEGAHSYIYWADRVLELPQSIIAISLGAALLPTLSELWSQGKKAEMLEQAQSHLRVLLFLVMPAAIGMFVLAEPLVKALYMRGQFDLVAAQTTAMVVKVYAILLVASSFNKVMVPGFYAVKNTWLPALASATSLVFHIFAADQLVDRFGLQGLVTSTAMAGFLNMTIVFTCYQFMVGRLSFSYLAKSIFQFLPASLLMGGFAFYFYDFAIGLMGSAEGGSLLQVVSLLLTVAISVIIYFILSQLFKISEAQKVLRRFKRS